MDRMWEELNMVKIYTKKRGGVASNSPSEAARAQSQSEAAESLNQNVRARRRSPEEGATAHERSRYCSSAVVS